MMARPILGFLLRCMVIYAVLIVPWWGGMSIYRWGFCQVGNAVFYRIGGDGRVRFEAIDRTVDQQFVGTDHAKDVTLRLNNTANASGGHMDIKSALIGYRPTAFLIALVLATPIPWSRRGWAVLGGLVAVSAFVALRVWLQLADGLSNGDELSVYTLSPFWKGTLRSFVNVLVLSTAPGYIVPALLWMLVAVRREDWERIMNTDAGAAGTASRRASGSQKSSDL